MRAFVPLLLAVSGVGAVVFACSDAGFEPYCTGIPARGCIYDLTPDGSTNCRSDPTCAALYTADSKCAWTLVQKCPGNTPPTDAGAAARFQPRHASRPTPRFS